MERNLNEGQQVNGHAIEDPFADFPEPPADIGGWNDNAFVPIQDQQFFPPLGDFANQFPAYDQHQAYQPGNYGNYYNQQPYEDHNAFYVPDLQPMPFHGQYNGQNHEPYHPFPDEPVGQMPQDFHQPQPLQQQPADGGIDYRIPNSPRRDPVEANPQFHQPPQPAVAETIVQPPPQDSKPAAYPKSKSAENRPPSSPHSPALRGVLTPTLPYENPMQRMKELTRQSYGGSLAASAAAAEAAEARRNSPPRQKKEGAEMTVKDALQMHYQEQKRQKKQLRDQYYHQRLPNTSPVPIDLIFPKPTISQHGIQPQAPSLLVVSPPLEQSATTPATPTLPSIDAPKTSHVESTSPPICDVVTPLSHYPTPPSTKTDKIPLIQLESSDEHNTDEEDKISQFTELSHPNTPEESLAPLLTEQQRKDLNMLIKEEARAKSRSFMLLDAIKGIPMTLSERNLMRRRRQGLHPGTFSLIAKETFKLQEDISAVRTDLLPSTVTRKRPLEEKEGAKNESLPRKPGPRMEINENGEMVERVYVHVHHANVNDPEYTEDGVIMLKEEFHKQEKRPDMISYSYGTPVCPYEYCLWRVKRFDLVKPAPPESAVPSLPSQSSNPVP